ncbi:pq loop repeat-containing protein [Cystoisospora suis]|uniref:Pq loop repeat-containing protein n=1 Tax=Cystoisospora suis TaxID=483139 RepID=A0A2C6KCR3_9APIC|nr:pq loop repeat-containing protein [Cystoisospora suis]
MNVLHVRNCSELYLWCECLHADQRGYHVPTGLQRAPLESVAGCAFGSAAAQNLCILMLFWKYRLPRNCVSEATKEKLDTARQASSEQGRSVPFLSRFSTFSSRERLLCRALLMVLFTTLSYARLVAERQSAFPRTLSGILGVAPFPLLFLSRLPQIRQNWAQQHTGQLSAVTGFLMLCGNLARLFTSLVSLSDIFVTLSCLLASVLNAVPLFQIYWYRKNTKRILASQRKDQASTTLRQKLG